MLGQFIMQHNNNLPNNSCTETYINNSRNGSDGVQIHSSEILNNKRRFDQMNGENDDASSNEQIDLPNFIDRFVKKLQNDRNNYTGVLLQMNISPEHEKLMRDCIKKPQIMLRPEVFSMLSSVFENVEGASQDTFQDEFGQLELPLYNTPEVSTIHANMDTYLVGEQLNESTERRILKPADEDSPEAHEEIDALLQTDMSACTIPKDIPSSGSLSLASKLLLLQVLEIIDGGNLIKLKVIHHPKPLWHVRTTTDLAKNRGGLFLKSDSDDEYIVIEWSNLMNYNSDHLFVRVQLRTHDGKINPSKFIAPPGTIINEKTPEDWITDESHGLNRQTNTCLYPLTDEHSNCQMSIKVMLLNPNKKLPKTNKIEDDIKKFIRNEISKICKLSIDICRRTGDQLERVSEYVETNLIKESLSTEDLTPIDRSKVTPEHPCGCGNEPITIKLNTNSEKDGFIIEMDERRLAREKYTGIHANAFTIDVPPKEPGTDTFHLTIEKVNVLKTITETRDPYQDPAKDTLFNDSITYAATNDNCQHAPPGKKPRRR